MLAGGAVLMTGALIAYSPHQLNPAHYSARSLFGLAYLVVFGSLIGYSAYAWLLGNAPIGQVSTYAYVNPVIAIALGALILGESITLRIVAGAVLILAAVALVVRRESRGEVAAQGSGFSGAANAGAARGAPRARPVGAMPSKWCQCGEANGRMSRTTSMTLAATSTQRPRCSATARTGCTASGSSRRGRSSSPERDRASRARARGRI